VKLLLEELDKQVKEIEDLKEANMALQ